MFASVLLVISANINSVASLWITAYISVTYVRICHESRKNLDCLETGPKIHGQLWEARVSFHLVPYAHKIIIYVV